ncbi:MAG: hypothetical protein M3179_05965 [Actinomycetota bacterium]|nr:hypothetical protein [Actinomycetota bacterium]
MTERRRRELRKLEGRPVHLALSDGSRLDRVSLVSVRTNKLWVFTEGHDVFLPIADVVDFYEAAA